MLGPRKPHVHHRHQALAAGERSRLVAEFREERQRLGKALRPVIVERGGLHLSLRITASGARLRWSGGCSRLTPTLAPVKAVAEGPSRIGEQASGQHRGSPLLAGRGLPWPMMSANLRPRTGVVRD